MAKISWWILALFALTAGFQGNAQGAQSVKVKFYFSAGVILQKYVSTHLGEKNSSFKGLFMSH